MEEERQPTESRDAFQEAGRADIPAVFEDESAKRDADPDQAVEFYGSREGWDNEGSRQGAPRFEDDLGPEARQAFAGLGSAVRGMFEGAWQRAVGAFADRLDAHRELWRDNAALRKFEARIAAKENEVAGIASQDRYAEQLDAFQGLAERHGINVPPDLLEKNAAEQASAAMRKEAALQQLEGLKDAKEAYEERRENTVRRITEKWEEAIQNHGNVLRLEEASRAENSRDIVRNLAEQAELVRSLNLWREKVAAGPDEGLGRFLEIPDMINLKLEDRKAEYADLVGREHEHDMKIGYLKRRNAGLQAKILRARGGYKPSKAGERASAGAREHAGSAASDAGGARLPGEARRWEARPPEEAGEDASRHPLGEFVRHWNELSGRFPIPSRLQQTHDFSFPLDKKAAFAKMQAMLIFHYGKNRRREIENELRRLSLDF